MTIPGVELTERDGGLGVVPPSDGDLYAVVGVATAGPFTPQAFGDPAALVAAYTNPGELPGPAIEAAALELARFRRPVVFTRVPTATDGEDGTLDTDDYTGTSAPTLDAANAPLDGVDVVIEFVGGGTIGTAGIVYRYSLDDGTNWSNKFALGTATTLTIDELATGGWAIDFAAGNIAAGSFLRVRTVAPQPDSAGITAGLTALKNWAGKWEMVFVECNLDATLFDAIEGVRQSMTSSGKDRMWLASFRMPNAGESEADYKTAFDAALGAKSTTHGAVLAGAMHLVSGVSGREYRRPFAHVAVAREVVQSHEIHTGDVDLGALPGRIRDRNGNPLHHDETINPGLDDSRAYVARTHDEYPGVYVNQPRIFSSDTSDFQFVPHRRVMNLAKTALRAYLKRRLAKPILVSKKTGLILEREALAIEKGATRAVEAVLKSKPKASGAAFVLNRTDLLLSSKTLTGSLSIVPLAYVNKIIIDPVSYTNPALTVQAA